MVNIFTDSVSEAKYSDEIDDIKNKIGYKFVLKNRVRNSSKLWRAEGSEHVAVGNQWNMSHISGELLPEWWSHCILLLGFHQGETSTGYWTHLEVQ